MIILGTNSIKDTGYDVANSCRFDYGSADYLNKTLGTATNRKKFTSSFWIKRTELYVNNSRQQNIFTAGTNSGTNVDQIYFRYDTLDILGYESSSVKFQFRTTQLFRDTSSWGNIVFAFDSTQSTASNRVKIYYNGSQITDFSTETYPTQNLEPLWNLNTPHYYGKNTSGANYGAYYLSECCFIDGQALDPTSFGEFDEDSGIWKPIDVSGLTFGNNGFYLDFEDSSALGNDAAGSNNFTANNLTAIDQSTDTCTNNFATLNPLNVPTSAAPAFSEGNLKSICNASGKFMGSLTIAVSSGKWFWEIKATELSGGNSYIGVGDETAVAENARQNNNGYGNSVMYRTNGQTRISTNSSTVDASYGNSYTQGDIIGVALNADDNQVTFYKNGTPQNSGTPVSIPTPTGFLTGFIALGLAQNETFEINTGSPPFAISSGNADANGYGNFEYAVPSGYFSLNTKNLSEFG